MLNRDQILEGAHDREWDPFDRSIDIRISRIRKKIEHNPVLLLHLPCVLFGPQVDRAQGVALTPEPV